MSKASAGLRLDDYLPYRLSVASECVSQLIARAYQARFSLRIPEWRLIAVLADQSDLTPQDLVARTRMDKVTVSRAARALLRRGLAARAPHAIDRRSHTLSLTVDGARLFEHVAPVAKSYEAALLQTLTPADISTLKSLLGRIQARAGELMDAAADPPDGLAPVAALPSRAIVAS